MTIFKKLISILLCIIMITSVVASCDQSDNYDTDTENIEIESDSEREYANESGEDSEVDSEESSSDTDNESSSDTESASTSDTESESSSDAESDHTHEWSEWQVARAATCVSVGEEARACACGERETRVLEKTEHSYTSAVTAPTCTEKGYTTYTCTCSHSYKDNYVDATGHSLGNWGTVTSPTCTATGTARRDCSKCDHYETRMTEATGHDYTSAVTAPTCTEKGYTTYTCTCSHSYKDNYVDATGHDFGTEWKKSTTEHWQKCACGAEKNRSKHVNVDGNSTCDTCGYIVTLKISDNSINDYKIIYYDSVYAKQCAQAIQSAIADFTGVTLEIASDSASVSEYEILVGKTNRDESKAVRAEYDRPNVYYDVEEINGKLVIMAEGCTTLDIIDDKFIEYLNTIDPYSNIVGKVVSGDIIDSDNMFERANGTELRIMMWNMAASTDFPDRIMQAEMEADIILMHLPDVFGTNELYNTNVLLTHVLLDISEYYYEIESEYDFPEEPHRTSGVGHRPQKIFVKKDAGINVIDAGWRSCKHTTSIVRSNPWAILETKDGNKFIYTVGHYDNSYVENEWAIEHLETIAYAQEQSGCSYILPTIVGGDLFTGYSNPPKGAYAEFINAGYRDAQRAAIINANNNISHGTFHDIGKCEPTRADLDLVFYNSGLEALKFKVVIHPTALNSSDHCPVVADLSFESANDQYCDPLEHEDIAPKDHICDVCGKGVESSVVDFSGASTTGTQNPANVELKMGGVILNGQCNPFYIDLPLKTSDYPLLGHRYEITFWIRGNSDDTTMLNIFNGQGWNFRSENKNGLFKHGTNTYVAFNFTPDVGEDGRVYCKVIFDGMENIMSMNILSDGVYKHYETKQITVTQDSYFQFYLKSTQTYVLGEYTELGDVTITSLCKDVDVKDTKCDYCGAST